MTEFTFPLEQKKTYGVGRRAEKDVVFLSKRARLDEGRLEIGDWDPSAVRSAPCSLECWVKGHVRDDPAEMTAQTAPASDIPCLA